MIKVGQQKQAKYWGRFSVSKVARVKQPVECDCEEVGTALFDPTIVKIQWEKSPSEDNNEFWFPYWITIGGKEKYGQFAPMIGEKALMELPKDAVEQDFFSKSFLKKLQAVVNTKLNQTPHKEEDECEPSATLSTEGLLALKEKHKNNAGAVSIIDIIIDASGKATKDTIT
ncbi:hypothetical protein ACFLWS_08020 [Chloroflexota bacterium]